MLAEYQWELIVPNTRDGLAIARASPPIRRNRSRGCTTRETPLYRLLALELLNRGPLSA